MPDRVDLYGLMKGGADADPAYDHPILGTRGMAVPDTWMSRCCRARRCMTCREPLPGQDGRLADGHHPRRDQGLDVHGSSEAKAAGGKELTGGAAWGMAALAAVQQGAVKAREPESQTNIPPVMLQEMTWTHGRAEVAASVQKMLHEGADIPAGTAGSRIARLTSGTLAGEKEFRPSSAPPSSVTRIETPGLFSRGYDNPLDTDAVTVMRRAANQAPLPSRVSTPETSHADLADFHARAVAAAPDPFSKRRAIAQTARRSVQGALPRRSCELEHIGGEPSPSCSWPSVQRRESPRSRLPQDMAALDLLGAQFIRMASNLGHRGASRSLPWVSMTQPTRTFKAAPSVSFKAPSAATLRSSIARATRGHKTG